MLIRSDSKPHALANRMDLDADFRAYAQEMMSSFHIGITSLISYKQKLKDLIGEGQQAVLEKITEILRLKIWGVAKKWLSLMKWNGVCIRC